MEEKELIDKINELQDSNAKLSRRLNEIETSVTWKSTKPFRIVLDSFRKLGIKIVRIGKQIGKLGYLVIYTTQKFGIKVTIDKILHESKRNIETAKTNIETQEIADGDEIWEELSKWIDSTPHSFIDIFSVPMGWNTPLFQRFQHISLQAGNAGGISIYGAHPSIDQDVRIYKLVSPTLCIVNLDDYMIKQKLFQLLDTKKGLKYIRIQSIDLATTMDEICNYMERGYEIVYEYIDELTPQITGNIPEFVFKRHEAILKNENITAIATSDKLFRQMQEYRSKNMAMINNGVDYEHWHIKKDMNNVPDDLKEIVNQGKIIVGYHGALAKWVDYDLLREIALDGRFLLLLIGHEHDDNLKASHLLELENVYYLGAKPYQILNRYASFYDIAILPFVINNITLSVSPVKIFEYMALEKPVVTYALPECKKYESCLCAETKEEFMECLDKAIECRNDEHYIELLRQDALNNTWQSITKKTVELVEKHYNSTQEKKKLEESKTAVVLDNVVNYNVSAQYKENYINQVLHIPDAPNKEECVPLSTRSYIREKNDTKIIAYYLTQFHPDEHNEKWWGRGTTEWNNVLRAVPQYTGHYQPRLPGELGCYDLRIKDNMKRQIELAKMYGVFGFSFYYYWFDGERLLEKPLEMFLSNKDLDFPFMLCWANENWTKKYDGTNEGILMKQPNTFESYKNVITDMIRFLGDARYIEVDGKKVITVYRPSLIPKAKEVLLFWRDYCRKNGIGELYLIAVKENTIETDWIEVGFDAVSEFHPGTLYQNCNNVTEYLEYIRRDFGGEVFSYKDIVDKQKYFRYNYPKLYRAVMPMWDNTARRNNKGMIFEGSTPELYEQWLKDVIKEQKHRKDLEDNFIFINAWNEWGEGAYLEPDKRWGYAYLEATRNAVEAGREL